MRSVPRRLPRVYPRAFERNHAGQLPVRISRLLKSRSCRAGETERGDAEFRGQEAGRVAASEQTKACRSSTPAEKGKSLAAAEAWRNATVAVASWGGITGEALTQRAQHPQPRQAVERGM
jgi:hypothetical protein